jgi:hypothetical protein
LNFENKCPKAISNEHIWIGLFLQITTHTLRAAVGAVEWTDHGPQIGHDLTLHYIALLMTSEWEDRIKMYNSQ